MKRNFLVILTLLAGAAFAAAQAGAPTSDVLGAHLNYGRGCAACHAPHSGAWGNGIGTTDAKTGSVALWGEDVSKLVGVTIVTGQSEHGTYSETLPGITTTAGAEATGLLMCLSCHDGNLATGAMMKNKVYETLPSTYGGNAVPTLLGNDNTGVGNYLNDHPVGTQATIGCGGAYNWDCTVSATGKIVPGPNMTAFIKNYGFFVSPAVLGGTTPYVVCTTCHNQHLMNVVNVTAANSGLPPGPYQTMFFVRAPYNPASTTLGSNQTAQFCRQCHGGEANEMNGSLTIPTTF
jgi:hypothetical protein